MLRTLMDWPGIKIIKNQDLNFEEDFEVHLNHLDEVDKSCFILLIRRQHFYCECFCDDGNYTSEIAVVVA